jgi:hypothetical protein
MRKLNIKLVIMFFILGPFSVVAGNDTANNNSKDVSKVEVSEVILTEDVIEENQQQLLESERAKIESEAANLATPCLILPDCLGF